jgi:CheY-like chemotaxis protein
MRQPGFDQTVIIADNDRSMRDLLRCVLDQPRRAVFLAANGIEAIEYAQSITADLVLLDMDMPRLGGLDACARIRDLPHYRDVPIVILTAYDGERARRKASQMGATAFFTKPFSSDGLRRGLVSILAGRGALR